MKKLVTALLALCLCLLAACVGLENAAPAGQAPESPSDEEKPDYRLETIEAQRSFAASDGTELASYAYALPTLSVANLERLPPEEAEPAQRAVDTFNEKMRGMLNTSVAWGEDVADSAAGVYGDGYLTGSYYDESSYSANICGEIVSVRVDTASYTGGAHPNSYSAGYLFDLAAGQFIDPTQIAEDPEAFRAGAAALLLEKADGHPEQDAFWQDYADILAHWNEGTVRFNEEGMEVIYSPYELGPYAIGEVELSLGWEELEPLIGPSGMERLGRGGTE